MRASNTRCFVWICPPELVPLGSAVDRFLQSLRRDDDGQQELSGEVTDASAVELPSLSSDDKESILDGLVHFARDFVVTAFATFFELFANAEHEAVCNLTGSPCRVLDEMELNVVHPLIPIEVNAPR